MESKEENERNDRGAQKPYIANSHDHAKISHDCANWTRGEKLCCRLRRMFELISHSHAKWSKKCFKHATTTHLRISHDHAKWEYLM